MSAEGQAEVEKGSPSGQLGWGNLLFCRAGPWVSDDTGWEHNAPESVPSAADSKSPFGTSGRGPWKVEQHRPDVNHMEMGVQRRAGLALGRAKEQEGVERGQGCN